jgi:AcrR family transcriptional regulator
MSAVINPASSAPRLAGLKIASGKKRNDSIARLCEAADHLFRARGYFDLSVDEIATFANVTRKTFYSHFGSKADFALDWADRKWPAFQLVWLSIIEKDFTDLAAITEWLTELRHYIEHDPDMRALAELGVVEPRIVAWRNTVIRELIDNLGKVIPAFACQGAGQPKQLRWGSAYLLISQMTQEFALISSGHNTLEPTVLTALLAKSLHNFILGKD